MNFFICVIASLLIFLENFSYFVIFGCFYNIVIRFFLQIILVVVGSGGGSGDVGGGSCSWVMVVGLGGGSRRFNFYPLDSYARSCGR